MSIYLRPAIKNDLPTLLQFEQGVIEFERAFDSTLLDENAKYYDLDALIASEDALLLVAEKAGQLIGSGYARIEKSKVYLKHKQHAYLGFMFVLPDFRGQGVNKLIMDALAKWSKEKGITELRLDVYEGNLGAVRAYQKVGFTKHLVEMRLGI